MPTDLITGTNPYSGLTAAQILERQAELLRKWEREDAERRARFAAIMTGTEVK